MYKLKKCEKIEIEQGAIYLGPSNKKQSVGYLELNPYTSLTLHIRPGSESLTQIKGRCDMVWYLNNKHHVNTIRVDDKPLVIPAGAYHIHVNPYNKVSLTYWDFDGDITEIIETIRKSGE